MNNVCPNCGAYYRVSVTDVGRHLPCKKCSVPLEVSNDGLVLELPAKPLSLDDPADESPIAHFESLNGILVMVGVIAFLFVGFGMWSGYLYLAKEEVRFRRESDWFAFSLICVLPIVMGLWLFWDIAQRWSETLTVLPSGLVRTRRGTVEAVHWAAVTNMEVEVGGWMLEWVLLQLGASVPRITISSVSHGNWVFRGYMAEIEELCQIVPSVWTAYQAGMR